jgi:hypothetical protein
LSTNIEKCSVFGEGQQLLQDEEEHQKIITQKKRLADDGLKTTLTIALMTHEISKLTIKCHEAKASFYSSPPPPLLVTLVACGLGSFRF